MSDADVQLVRQVFGGPEIGRPADIAGIVADEAHWERNRDAVAPDLAVRFVVPPSGVEVLDRQEFTGIEGLKEGWGIWMEAWEYFMVSLAEVIDLEDGRVLLLSHADVKTRSGGVEMDQDVAVLCRVAEDRITEAFFYLDPQQARREAGLE